MKDGAEFECGAFMGYSSCAGRVNLKTFLARVLFSAPDFSAVSFNDGLREMARPMPMPLGLVVRNGSNRRSTFVRPRCRHRGRSPTTSTFPSSALLGAHRISSRPVFPRDIVHRIHSIQHQIQQHLLQLHAVATHGRQFWRHLQREADLSQARIWLHQRHGFRQQLAEIHVFLIRAWRRFNNTRIRSITRPARRSSRRMSARMARISSKSGFSFCRKISAASAFRKMAPSGWFNSWASADVNCPMVDTRVTCASSVRWLRISASARRRCRRCARSAPIVTACARKTPSRIRIKFRCSSHKVSGR